jgi:hypothetical protein
VESFDPIGWRHAGLEQKGADIISGIQLYRSEARCAGMACRGGCHR